MSKCYAVQYSDQMVCERCQQTWDVNDGCEPECRPKDNTVESDVEIYSELLVILKDIKKNPVHRQGICGNIRRRLSGSVYSTFRKELNFVNLALETAKSWPEYSGEPNCPVHTNKTEFAIRQYNKTWFYWTRLTSYGRARRRLLDFLINHFEELVKQ